MRRSGREKGYMRKNEGGKKRERGRGGREKGGMIRGRYCLDCHLQTGHIRLYKKCCVSGHIKGRMVRK